MPVTVKELLDQARTALATEQEESGPIDVVKEADVRLALPHSRTTGTGLLIITCAPKHHDSKLLSHKMSTPAVGLDDLNYGVNRGVLALFRC